MDKHMVSGDLNGEKIFLFYQEPSNGSEWVMLHSAVPLSTKVLDGLRKVMHLGDIPYEKLIDQIAEGLWIKLESLVLLLNPTA